MKAKIISRTVILPCYVLCVGLGAFLTGCNHSVKRSPTENLKEMAYGHLLARAIHQVAYFRIADEVDGVTSVAEIAKKLKLDNDSLARVLRVLMNHGIFTQNNRGVIEHNFVSVFEINRANLIACGISKRSGCAQMGSNRCY